MSGLLIGYARVSTDEQDLTAQRDALTALGVAPERIYVDYADPGVMPTPVRTPCSAGVNGRNVSA